jgi:hypothetical protein
VGTHECYDGDRKEPGKPGESRCSCVSLDVQVRCSHRITGMLLIVGNGEAIELRKGQADVGYL